MQNLEQPEWMRKIENLASQVAEQKGCVLYDLEMVGAGKHRVLRVFIDKTEGVGIEECTSVTHGLNEVLDADEDVIPGGPYSLEVSTPGVERILRLPWHFEKAVGQKIWLKTEKVFEELGITFPSIQKSKTLESVLEGFADGKLHFKTKEGEFQIPVDAIYQAHVLFEMKNAKKQDKK
ncbi:MAG: ribosome maturation factor RimP [Bdellovibrionota bacterium]